MNQKRCEYCGHLLDAPSDNRDMAMDVVRHGREIVQFLVQKGLTTGHICNFCYAHVSIFRKENPGEYESLKQRDPNATYVWVVAWFTDFNRFVDMKVFGRAELAHEYAKSLKEGKFFPEVYRERVRT